MGFYMVHLLVTITQSAPFCEFKFALGNGAAILETQSLGLDAIKLSPKAGANGVHGMATQQAILPGRPVELLLVISMPATRVKFSSADSLGGICISAGADTTCDCPYARCKGGQRRTIAGSACHDS